MDGEYGFIGKYSKQQTQQQRSHAVRCVNLSFIISHVENSDVTTTQNACEYWQILILEMSEINWGKNNTQNEIELEYKIKARVNPCVGYFRYFIEWKFQ